MVFDVGYTPRLLDVHQCFLSLRIRRVYYTLSQYGVLEEQKHTR